MSKRFSFSTKINKQRAAKLRRERAERLAVMEDGAIYKPTRNTKRPSHLGPIWREKE